VAELDLTGAWYGRGTVSGRRCNRPYHNVPKTLTLLNPMASISVGA